MIDHECICGCSRIYDFTICQNWYDLRIEKAKFVNDRSLKHILRSNKGKVDSRTGNTKQAENQYQMGV